MIIDSLDEFVRRLLNTDIVYSDKNPVYKEFYGKRNTAKKGIKTNLIESLKVLILNYAITALTLSEKPNLILNLVNPRQYIVVDFVNQLRYTAYSRALLAQQEYYKYEDKYSKN